jgi:hypothetical protein
MKQNIYFITIAFQPDFRICHQEGPKNQEGLELNETHQLLTCIDINLLAKP